MRFGTANVWPSSTASRSVSWVNGVSTQPDGGPLANYVQNNQYTIGYAKKKTAASRIVGLGALKTKFDTFVAPSDASMQLAATSTALPLPAQDSWSQLSMGTQTSSAWAYPATHFSYFILFPYLNNAGAPNGDVDTALCLAEFLLFTSYNDGQVALPAYYVKLTDNVKSTNVAAITQYLVKTVVPKNPAATLHPWASLLVGLLVAALAA